MLCGYRSSLHSALKIFIRSFSYQVWVLGALFVFLYIKKYRSASLSSYYLFNSGHNHFDASTYWVEREGVFIITCVLLAMLPNFGQALETRLSCRLPKVQIFFPESNAQLICFQSAIFSATIQFAAIFLSPLIIFPPFLAN